MIVANLLGALDGPELLIILLILLLLFGGAKLPQLARSLGQAKHEFHAATAAELSGDTPNDPSNETVTITRAELDRLRAAADDSASPTIPHRN